jgi:hypothetical protein
MVVAQQRHAPDREQRGFHPQDAVLDALCARRVMPGVMPLSVHMEDFGEISFFFRYFCHFDFLLYS